MQNLPATTTNPGTLTPALSLNEKLSALLLGRDSPVVGPNTAAELRTIAAQPEPETAFRHQVDTMIGKLALATAQPKLSDREVEERLELYWLALKDIPLVDLHCAFAELVKTATFLPTPAEIRTAALKPGITRRFAKSRAAFLVAKHEREWENPAQDYVDPAEVKALLQSVGLNQPPHSTPE